MSKKTNPHEIKRWSRHAKDQLRSALEVPVRAPVRPGYDEYGVDGYYTTFASSYRNPHEAVLRILLLRLVPLWQLDLSNVLDLACGSGEATLALQELGAAVVGCDPFTAAAYLQRTGLNAETHDFISIAGGALEGRRHSLIVCSFALHLCEASLLPKLAHQLARIAPAMLVLTPHKRPTIKPQWGWTLETEVLELRIRARLYRSNLV